MNVQYSCVPVPNHVNISHHIENISPNFIESSMSFVMISFKYKYLYFKISKWVPLQNGALADCLH